MIYIITEQCIDIDWARCKELVISRLLNNPHKLETWALNNSPIEIFSTMFQIDRFNSRAVELFNRFSYTDPYRECMDMLH